MKRLLVVIMAIAGMAAFAGEPIVSDVTAKQRYPWNGLVDINCKVSGIDGIANGLYFAVAVVNLDSGKVRHVSHFWSMQSGTNSSDRQVHTNGNCRLLWDAKADLGTGLYSNMVVRVTFDTHNRVQLWEGGPYWADTNIGAEKPWESGYYFWWGDTVGYKRENDMWVASDAPSSSFSFISENIPTDNKTFAMLQNEGWITADNVLAPEHDAANVQWGGGWRMPTDTELTALQNNCDWTWTYMNRVSGYVVRGKGDYASASIFLPVSGYGDGNSILVSSSGYYWASVPDSEHNDYSWGLFFYGSSHYWTSRGPRYFGENIRPVQGFAK